MCAAPVQCLGRFVWFVRLNVRRRIGSEAEEWGSVQRGGRCGWRMRSPFPHGQCRDQHRSLLVVWSGFERRAPVSGRHWRMQIVWPSVCGWGGGGGGLQWREKTKRGRWLSRLQLSCWKETMGNGSSVPSAPPGFVFSSHATMRNLPVTTTAPPMIYGK